MNKNVKLKDNNNVLYPESNGGGIDFNNILHSSVGGPYIATEDCYAMAYITTTENSGGILLKIDGNNAVWGQSASNQWCYVNCIVKKGSTVVCEAHGNAPYGQHLTIYGIKHN